MSKCKDYRVCHISTMRNFGGVECMLADLLIHAESSGVDHSIISISSDADVVATIRKAGVKYYEPHRLFRLDISIVFKMAVWLKKEKIDVVHVYNASASIWGGIAARLAGVAVLVCGEHGTIWNSKPPIFWLYRLIYKNSSAIIANSKACKKLIVHRMKVSEDKVTVVYNAIPEFEPAVSSRNPYKKNDVEVIVGSVGRLVPVKNFTTFIKAAAIIAEKNRNVRFVLIGGGEEESKLRELVRECDLDKVVYLSGWKKDAKLQIPYFDIFVSTSIREPFGNVLIEAALSKVPCIAPCVDGIPEAVVENDGGIIIDPTVTVSSRQAQRLPKKIVIRDRVCSPLQLDPNILADAVLRLVGDPEMRGKLAGVAYDRAKGSFTLKKYQRGLECIYRRCLFGS